jgi:four helix bundle protein
MYVRAEQIADSVWELVGSWSRFAQNAVGDQFVTAADSIGANIAEAGGRYHANDVKKFLYDARESSARRCIGLDAQRSADSSKPPALKQ